MGAFENITDKIVLLLEKTRDTLLKDLEKEFSGLRKALEQVEDQTKGAPSDMKDALETTQNIFDSCEQVIKAVFAQVGVDISHCDNAENFMNLLSKPLALVDNLAESIEKVAGEGEPDYGALAESVYQTFQDLMQLVKDFQNVEMGKISGELEKALGDAWEQFSLKDFAMSLLEYILITVLRNGREVFADEVKYVKLQANALYKQVDSAVKDVRGQIEGEIKNYLKEFEKDADQAATLAKTLFRQSVDDMENVYNTLAADIRKDIDDALNSQTADEIRDVYDKISGVLSKTYAILDFFGIVGQKTVEIKLPEKFIKALKSAAGTVVGAIQDATDEIGGFVRDITEDANGAISYATDQVREIAGPAHEKIQKAAGAIGDLTGTSLEELDITADLVNLPAVGIPDFSTDIEAAGSALSGALSKYIGGGINYLQGFSFPITIPTFRWSKVEKMFTDPEAYFLEQYPVDSIEDAEAIATKVIDIVRMFNPDIPDFSSIRSMLESLLRELGEKVLAYAEDATAEARRELWTHVKPLMTMIRKVLDLLEEMYEALKRDAHNNIQEIKRTFLENVIAPLSEEEKKEEPGKDKKDDKKGENKAENKGDKKEEKEGEKKEGEKPEEKKEEKKELPREVKEFAERFKKEMEGIKSKATAQKLYDEIIKPSVLEVVKKADDTVSEDTVKKIDEKAKEVLEAWGTGVHTHLKEFYKKDSWESRMDSSVAALETTFAGDVSAVKSFLSPSSLDDLVKTGGRFNDLKGSLDISQYITIISETFDNFSFPNPDIYYEAFKQAVGSILGQAEKEGVKFGKGQVASSTSEIASEIWGKVRNKALKPMIREVEKQVRKTVRLVVKNTLDKVLDQLPSFQDAKGASEKSGEAPSTLRLYTNTADQRIADVKNLTPSPAGGGDTPAPEVTTKADGHVDVEITRDWLKAANAIAFASVEFSQSDKSYADVIALVGALYKSIPESAKDYIADLLPSLPDNDFMKELAGFFKQMDFKGDLDKTFAILTVLNMKTDKDEKDKEGEKPGGNAGGNAPAKPKPKPAAEEDDGKPKFKASALLQLVVFAGEVPVKKDGAGAPGSETGPGAQGVDGTGEQKELAEKDGPKKDGPGQDGPGKDGSGQDGPGKDGSGQDGPGKDGPKKEEEKEPALFFTIILRGEAGLTFNIGSNHTMTISVSGGTGSGEVKTIDEKTTAALQKGIGFHVTRDWEFHGDDNWESLNAMFFLNFKRKTKGEEKNPLQVFDTKYLSMQIGNYPQLFYLGYGKSYPAAQLKEFGIEEEKDKKDGDKKGGDTKGATEGGAPQQQGSQQQGSQQQKKPQGGDSKGGQMPEGNKLQVGYVGAVQDALISLHLDDVAFVKEVLKDDIELGFDTYLWYDYHKGFDFGGDVRLHLVYDLNHKKFGPLVIDSFSVDAGTDKEEKGKLNLVVGTTFQVEFSDALVIAVENLGLGFRLKYKDEDGKFGDFDLDTSISYPTGFGVTIDTSVAKGGGFISYDRETCEFFGFFTLDILEKVGVKAYLLCDPGTAAGHFFSLVVLLSATFTPGIPLGMGFSLTAVGGTLGLNRSLNRDAISNGVRTGTLDQVFFAGDPGEHLAEMKSNVVSYFPAMQGQFFLGFLGEISFEPVVSCSFGLLLQLPKPVEIIIVGALKVALKDVEAAEKIFKINVYFAGGINFDTGMWFDASLVDSHLVGLTLSGDMAFRLNWGGQKGFLLSIGGFHPAYKPEAGLNVGRLRRTAMKLDYEILKISLESYLAVTSNTFQIGARLDVVIGWKKFGLVGYAGFDALFQFDPFLFMFNACAGVDVTIGSWKVLTASVNLDVSGPAPWHVVGKAKFKALGIPVNVNFSLTWGEKTPRLPDKKVEILPLLLKEWENDKNWTVDNHTLTGKNEVYLLGHEADEMVLQPYGSITFNQSALPLKTEESLEKMDLCNDAVPSDYDILAFKTVNGLNPGSFLDEDNDFAPVLYKNMTIKEKLASESYVKYNSGFTLDEKDKRVCTGTQKLLTRSVKFAVRGLTAETELKKARKALDSSVKQTYDTSPVTIDRNVSFEFVSYTRRTRAAFDRYIATLDKMAGMKVS